MLKKHLINHLYSYNIHIGHIDCYNSQLNYYILGRRFYFYIIDINKTFFLLKKVIFFLKTLSLNNGSLLFHYSKYFNLNIIYKCVLLSISKNSNQQIITYNWRYGSIGNYFFSFYILIKDITRSWAKKQNYLFNFEKKLNLYYHSDLEGNKLGAFEYLFLSEPGIPYKFQKRYTRYSNWYQNWIKDKNAYSFWKSKKKSLKVNNFLRQLCLNDINNVLKKKKMLNFKYLFLKLFYYIYLKKKDPFLLNIDLTKLDFLDEDEIHGKFLSYWRFILYFKYFSNYYQVPDALFSVFPENNDMVINEYSSANYVSIGLIDTVSSIKNVNYPIISNDDSLIVIIFYFTLFSNLFLENKLNIYNFFRRTNK